MSSSDTLAFLEKNLEEQIRGFDKSRIYYRKMRFRLSMSTAILSAVLTVIIGIGKVYQVDWWFIIPLTFSATLTVLAAYEAFLRPKELWIQKTDTWIHLQNIYYNLQYAKLKYSEDFPQSEIDSFYASFDRILMDEHRVWMTERTGSDQAQRRP